MMVDKDDFRPVLQRGATRKMGKTCDDHELPFFGMMGRSAVDLDGAGSLGRRNDVGFKALSPRYIPDMDLFMGDQVGRLHEAGIYGNASFVVKVCRGHPGPMDLGFEQRRQHDGVLFQDG